MAMKEFGWIEKYFAPLTLGAPAACGLKDDAAIIDVPAGYQMVITKDAISEGIHFIGTEDPALIARKLIRTNLSDLAAMGAEPAGMFLAIILPREAEESWVARFAAGMKEDQLQFPVPLLGGDTTSSTAKGVSASLTAYGIVPHGKALTRSKARIGDDLYFTGTLGDSALGLTLLKQEMYLPLSKQQQEFLTRRYLLPEPRVALGKALVGIATSAIDVSDGLLQDVGHICKQSGCAAQISCDDLPLSEAASAVLAPSPAYISRLLSGGDDYELAFTAPASQHVAVESLAHALGIRITRIGSMVAGSGVHVIGSGGETLVSETAGWQHF